MRFFTTLTDRYFPLHPPIVGLDVSSRAVKAVFLKETRRGLLLSGWGEKTFASGAVEGGLVQNADVLLQALTNVWDDLRLKTKERWVIASLPEEQVFIRLITMPVLPKAELQKAIDLELEANVPLPRNEIYADWFLFPQERDATGVHQDIMLVAAPKNAVDTLVGVFDRAGMTVIAMEPESQALARLLGRTYNNENDAVLAVDLGATATRILVLANGWVRLSTTMSLSGEGMTDTIAKARHIDQAQAERLKRYIGIEDSKEGYELFRILEPSLRDLVVELQRSSAYWEERSDHRHGLKERIGTIVLSGGGANLKGLAQFLAFHTRMTVNMADPALLFTSDRKGIRIAPSFSRPATPFDPITYTAALGLALRGAAYRPF
ncbi:MAG: type IV pilus assembly protein PilM [bacterium]|nr:type IV pilus assembly protein PilM [bacterium]MDZ4296645.1 type IV pilus assembly protein PilM [Patescibacteria group bacterium]